MLPVPPLTTCSRVPKSEGVSQPVFEAWVLNYSENQYDVERTNFCGLKILKRYETSTPYVGFRTPSYDQDELRGMTLDAVSGYHAANKRCLPSRLLRGRAKSYEQHLDERIQKLPRPVQSELNLLLGDRESATCNRFRRRDWTVVMLREEYRYKFATAEHEEVKKSSSKRYWKKGDKRPVHYLFVLRGEDGKVAADDKGMHTTTRHGNPWKRVDETERREKERERHIRRHGKSGYDHIDDFFVPDDDALLPERFHAPPFPSPRDHPAPDLVSHGTRLAREDIENLPPAQPFPAFGPPQFGNGGMAPPFPPPPPPPIQFSLAPLPAYGHNNCACRNVPPAFYTPPPPPPPTPPLNNYQRQRRMFAHAYVPPPPAAFPRPVPDFSDFSMPMSTPSSHPPPPPPLPLRQFWHPPPLPVADGFEFPAAAAAASHPHHHNPLRMRDDNDSDHRFMTHSAPPPSSFPAMMPTEYTGSSIGSVPGAPRLSNLTTPTTFSRVTSSNHTGGSSGPAAAVAPSVPATSPGVVVPQEEYDQEEDDDESDDSSYVSSSSSEEDSDGGGPSRSASPVAPQFRSYSFLA